jgi:hypothetical protein
MAQEAVPNWVTVRLSAVKPVSVGGSELKLKKKERSFSSIFDETNAMGLVRLSETQKKRIRLHRLFKYGDVLLNELEELNMKDQVRVPLKLAKQVLDLASELGIADEELARCTYLTKHARTGEVRRRFRRPTQAHELVLRVQEELSDQVKAWMWAEDENPRDELEVG